MLKLTKEQRDWWGTKPVRGSTFTFVIESGTEEETPELRAIRAREIGVPKLSYNYGPAFAPEWGYSFTHLDGCLDGMGREIKAWYPTPPQTRAEAVEIIREFLLRQYIREAPHPWISMNGHFPWHHYAGEFGFDMLCSEIGENINNYQWHIALNRGAAKQYGVPWSIDFSPWNSDTATEYHAEGNRVWPSFGCPNGGHSMSLMDRAFNMAFMAGAGEVVAEAGVTCSFYDEIDEDGLPKVTSYGEACQKFHAYSRENPDRGICYTPFAIALDRWHGAYSGLETRKAFDWFPYNKGDEMTWCLVDMLWPGGWDGGWVASHSNERISMVNSPYGDYYDVLLQNAPADLLNTYPCVILSGDIHLSEDEAAAYIRYVEQGGNLILNRAYLSQFPVFAGLDGDDDVVERVYGKGLVTIYGCDYDLTGLDTVLRQKIRKHIPFRVNQRLQQMVNVREDGSLLLTLINNSGVLKMPAEKEMSNPTESRFMRVTYTGEGIVTTVRNCKTGETYPAVNNTVEFYMSAGEVAVLEFCPQ